MTSIENPMHRALTRDVFQNRMIGVAEEMSAALRSSAYSSMIFDMHDYSCAVLTPRGEIIAQAETIAAQLGIMEFACRTIDKKLPIAQWGPGDIVICNDPYQGCTHTPDVVLFAPVFRDGELIAIASTIAHHVDIGGKAPCTTVPDNTELFGEGLIFPPMRLLTAGEPNQAIFDMLAANVRNPQASLGDLRAQIAGCRIGERRLEDIVAQYDTDGGAKHFLGLCDDVLTYGESYVSKSLQAFDGLHSSAELQIEDEVSSDEPMTLRCQVNIDNGSVTVDFTGTDAQRAHAMNCPYASTLSMANYAVKAVFAPDVPQNGGAMRPVKVVAPLGTLLNPRRPGAVGSRHYSAQACAEVVLKALRPLSPALKFAGTQVSFPALKAGGFDRRPERALPGGDPPYFVVTDILGGGGGATSLGNGADAIDTHGGNCSILSAEIMESICPIRVTSTTLVGNSGGTGRHRGGLAIARDYEFLSDGMTVNMYIQQVYDYARPWGDSGGGTGAGGAIIANPDQPDEKRLSSKAIDIKPKAGSRVRLRAAGGGGFGSQ